MTASQEWKRSIQVIKEVYYLKIAVRYLKKANKAAKKMDKPLAEAFIHVSKVYEAKANNK